MVVSALWSMVKFGLEMNSLERRDMRNLFTVNMLLVMGSYLLSTWWTMCLEMEDKVIFLKVDMVMLMLGKT